MKKYIFKIINLISSILGLYSKSIKLNSTDTFTEYQSIVKYNDIKKMTSSMELELENDILDLEGKYSEIGVIDISSFTGPFTGGISKEINLKDKFILNKKILITVNYFLSKTEITEEKLVNNIESYNPPKIKINDIMIDSSHNYYGLKGGHQESIASRYNCRKRETSSFFGNNWGGGGDTGNTYFPAEKLKGSDTNKFLKEILKLGLSMDKSTVNEYEKSMAAISSSLHARVNESGINWPIWAYRDNFPPIEVSAVSGGKQFFYYNSERFLIKLSGNEDKLNLNIDLTGCPYIKKCIITIETCSKYFK